MLILKMQTFLMLLNTLALHLKAMHWTMKLLEI